MSCELQKTGARRVDLIPADMTLLRSHRFQTIAFVAALYGFSAVVIGLGL